MTVQGPVKKQQPGGMSHGGGGGARTSPLLPCPQPQRWFVHGAMAGSRKYIILVAVLIVAYFFYKLGLKGEDDNDPGELVSSTDIQQVVDHHRGLGADKQHVLPVLGIVTHRRTDLLLQCLLSVDHPVTKLVVVQNGEHAPTRDFLKALQAHDMTLDHVEVYAPPPPQGK